MPVLLETSSGFKALLDLQMESQTGRMVSKVFRESLECFRAYAEYCCKMNEAIDKYEEIIAASPAAAKLFEDCKAESGQGFPFRVLLNVPMQRVLKYSLLLREIVKGTPDEHADKDGLLDAKDVFSLLASLVNETLRTYENITAVSKSLTKYDGPPLTDYYAFYMFKPQPAKYEDSEMAYKGPSI